MKLIKLTRTIAVNPEHVASVCEVDRGGVSVVMADGKAYGISAADIQNHAPTRKGELLDHITARLNGEV